MSQPETTLTPTNVAPVATGLYARDGGRLVLNQHSGQLKAWDSNHRIIAVLAGTQGGKTSWEPWWLWREVQRTADPAGNNDYLAVTASYDLFKLKFLPAMREVFEHLFGIARYWSADRILELADPTGAFWARRADDLMWGRIILRSAESGGGLESATARGAICDEAGQDSFTVDTYWALRRRLALHQGRMLLGTTLYNLGWIKTELYDPWLKAKCRHPEIDVIQFDSITNPSFPRAEYEAARQNLPAWKFDMQYRGRYTRPAGLIYDCFDEARHTCARFPIPESWQRYVGVDFGGVNTAAVFYAAEQVKRAGADGKTEMKETGRWYAYREYLAGDRTAAEHARHLLKGEPRRPRAVGGAPSEGQWRKEFAAGGLPIAPPVVSDVEVGLDRVYGAHKADEIIVFDDLHGYLEQKRSYRRVVDDRGEPTDKIEDKHAFHYMDAERYIVGWKRRGAYQGMR